MCSKCFYQSSVERIICRAQLSTIGDRQRRLSRNVNGESYIKNAGLKILNNYILFIVLKMENQRIFASCNITFWHWYCSISITVIYRFIRNNVPIWNRNKKKTTGTNVIKCGNILNVVMAIYFPPKKEVPLLSPGEDGAVCNIVKQIKDRNVT